MPVINGVYLKDFTALPGAVADADIIPIAISGNQIAYRTTVAGIVTDARITAKLLTGLSVTGGAVVAADTILQAFGKVQNQINGKQGTITLTTTGTSGAATLVSDTLNIPNYGSALTGYVPYTGATQDVDLGAFKLNAQSLHAKGTAGNGHLGLKHQSSAATAAASESSLFADSNGDMSFQNANLYLNKFVTSANSANRTYTFPDATGTVALVGGSGVGTVTSVAALTLGTTGSDLSSTVANGTTTPVITLQVPTASAANRGALSSADWSTFNGKQGTITLTTTGTSGAATFSANTLNIPNYADGGVLSLSAIGGTPNANAATITGTVLNLQPADASFGGVVTTGTQTFAGNKTLTGTTVIADGSNLGTPATLIGTNINGNANSLNIGGNAATVTTNANLNGVITSVGNTTSVANQTGTGSVIVMNTSPTLITPTIGVATATSLTTPALTVSLTSGSYAPFASAILATQSTAISLGYRDSSGGHNMAKIFGQRTNDGSGRSAIIIAVNAVDNDTDATVSDAKITVSGTTGNITLASALSGTSATFSGAVSKGSGSFRIEHPLPSLSETHQLVHSFVEAPQADLYYRGKLTLVNGKAQANIDEVSTMTEGTFEVLCRDVQCFTTNESGWDLIKGKVIGNIIYIESQNENSIDEISWMVIGERKDKHMMETEWTDENGKVIVEPIKPIEPEPIVPTDENLE